MWRSAVSLLLLLAVIGACGGDDEPVASGGAPLDLEDPGEYVGVDVTEDGVERPLVDGTRLTLGFRDGQLSAGAGCNSIGGPYSLEGDVLRVEALSMTDMGCDPPRHDQDQWFVDLLSSSPAVAPAEDGFVLTAGATRVRFVDRRIAEPPADLVGTEWEVTGFVDGDVAMSAAAPNEPGVLRFEENGFVTGNDGCNGFGHGGEEGGPVTDGLAYEVVGDTISFDGAPVSTQILCEDREYETRFHAVLSGTVRYEIDGENLTLLADGGRGVTFTAAG